MELSLESGKQKEDTVTQPQKLLEIWLDSDDFKLDVSLQ